MLKRQRPSGGRRSIAHSARDDLPRPPGLATPRRIVDFSDHDTSGALPTHAGMVTVTAGSYLTEHAQTTSDWRLSGRQLLALVEGAGPGPAPPAPATDSDPSHWLADGLDKWPAITLGTCDEVGGFALPRGRDSLFAGKSDRAGSSVATGRKRPLPTRARWQESSWTPASAAASRRGFEGREVSGWDGRAADWCRDAGRSTSIAPA